MSPALIFLFLYGVHLSASALALFSGRLPCWGEGWDAEGSTLHFSSFRSLGAKELKDLAVSLLISDWPGLDHVITPEPITVAGEVTHRLAGTRAGS